VLVVGTSISWVRLYDVRVNGSQQGGEIMSIMAHAATRPRKVKGIRCDSLQQHIIATFSDSPGEPIKIWDLRKAGVTAKPKLMIVQSQVAAVIDVAWSAARAGIMRFYYSICCDLIFLYEMIRRLSRRMHNYLVIVISAMLSCVMLCYVTKA
jgi:hypothetical protein